MFESILNLIISPAIAETGASAAGDSAQGGGLSFVMMLVVFFFFIYFAVWRPQSRRNKEQQTLMSSLSKGDEVVTAGGLLGRINKITDQYIVIAPTDQVEMIIQKTSVVSVLPKGTLKSLN